MERLTMDHINSLIDSEEYVVEEQYVQCILHVGEAPVVGISYRFSKTTHNPEMAKKAARDDAIRQLFSLEAYHQKRIRLKMGNFYSETADPDAIPLNLNFGNPYEGMAKRDVALVVGGVNCQEALAEYSKNLASVDPDRESALAEGALMADLCNATVLEDSNSREDGSHLNHRNKTL